MKPRWRIFSLLLYYLLFKSRPLNSVMKMELLKSPCENLSDHGRLPFNSIVKSETSSRLISIENKKVSFFCLLRLWCKYQRQWLHVNRPERCTHVCKKDGSGVLWCAASNEESKNSCWKWRQSCSLKIDEVSFKADRERERKTMGEKISVGYSKWAGDLPIWNLWRIDTGFRGNPWNIHLLHPTVCIYSLILFVLNALQ